MHAGHSLQKHRQKNYIHADKRRPEMHLAPELVHPAAGRFREPIIDAGEESKDGARGHDVMEMRNDVVGIVQIKVGAVKSEWNAGEAAYAKHRQKCCGEKHRHGEANGAAQSEMKNALKMITDGIEMMSVVVWKNALTVLPIPVSHMWCAQTINDKKPIVSTEKTSDL